MVDVFVLNEGSIWVFRPATDEAAKWMRQHTNGPWLGEGLCVEHRYGPDIVIGMREDGFIVEAGRVQHDSRPRRES